MFLQTYGQVFDCLGIVLVLEADFSEDEVCLEQPLLEAGSDLLGEPGLILAFELICENHLGELEHLPGQLEVGGVLLILDLLLGGVLSLLAVSSNLLLFLLRLSVDSSLTALGIFLVIFCICFIFIIVFPLLSVSLLLLVIFIILGLLLGLVCVNVTQDSGLKPRGLQQGLAVVEVGFGTLRRLVAKLLGQELTCLPCNGTGIGLTFHQTHKNQTHQDFQQLSQYPGK